MKLAIIQSEIKAPKGQMNKFGNYRYRSCEDIVEAAKPVLLKHGFALYISDEVVSIGNRFYIKATATIMDKEGVSFVSTAFAREEESKKGMDGAQITGAASSYARKYALNGLFAIDDTKDSDATNTHDKEIDDVPTEPERKLLMKLLFNSDLSAEEKDAAMAAINTCADYDKYQKIQHKLEARQLNIDSVSNPSAKQINGQVKKISKLPA